MRVSFEWLREFVPVEMTPEAVADRLTMAGLEVEAVEEWGTAFERIVVGQNCRDRRPSQHRAPAGLPCRGGN